MPLQFLGNVFFEILLHQYQIRLRLALPVVSTGEALGESFCRFGVSMMENHLRPALGARSFLVHGVDDDFVQIVQLSGFQQIEALVHTGDIGKQEDVPPLQDQAADRTTGHADSGKNQSSHAVFGQRLEKLDLISFSDPFGQNGVIAAFDCRKEKPTLSAIGQPFSP